MTSVPFRRRKLFLSKESVCLLLNPEVAPGAVADAYTQDVCRSFLTC